MMTPGRNCRACRFVEPFIMNAGAGVDGTCHWKQPVLTRIDAETTNGSWPPVHLDFGWCGKWKPQQRSLFERVCDAIA